MNIGLIILLSSIMLGTNGKNDADNSKIEATIEKDNNSQKSELDKDAFISREIIYSFIETKGTRQLFKDGKPFTGNYVGELYINGYLFTL